MENRKLLVVGIDPGITIGYAILDIEGNLLCLNSSKQIDLNMLISEAISFGKVVLVGTDKVKVPHFVEAFATKLGAKVISPEDDLKVEEKRKATGSYRVEDEHQGDALASALFAYRQIKALLSKIDIFVEENKKHTMKDIIRELVITKGISIKNAASIADKKDEESEIIEKAVVQKKLSENDFLRLYNKLKKYESEIRLIKKYSNSLKDKIKIMEADYSVKPEIKAKPDFREKRLRFLGQKLKLKEKELESSKDLIRKLNYILSNIRDFYVLKKLDTLGINEFSYKNKFLNVSENDMLLVDNPNIVSSGVIDIMKNRVFAIIHKKQISKKIENSLPFVFISAENLVIWETAYLGFVEKRHFDREKRKSDWVKKIVEDYRMEKNLVSG